MKFDIPYIKHLLEFGGYADWGPFRVRPEIITLNDLPNYDLGNELAFVHRVDAFGELDLSNVNDTFATIQSSSDSWNLTGKFAVKTAVLDSSMMGSSSYAQLTAENGIIMATNIQLDVSSQQVFDDLHSLQVFMLLISKR